MAEWHPPDTFPNLRLIGSTALAASPTVAAPKARPFETKPLAYAIHMARLAITPSMPHLPASSEQCLELPYIGATNPTRIIAEKSAPNTLIPSTAEIIGPNTTEIILLRGVTSWIASATASSRATDFLQSLRFLLRVDLTGTGSWSTIAFG